jgi:anaerobic magnesium-protoporphyrin IX monomethyl ester cyclase
VNNTAKVALINPPIPEGVFRHQLSSPIGAAYLAAVLERCSHEVKIVGCPTLKINCEQLKTEIGGFNPEVVGITSMTPTINSAFAVAHTVKEMAPDAMVVIGGHHATFMDKQILRESASAKRRTTSNAEKVLRWLLLAGVHFSANGKG